MSSPISSRWTTYPEYIEFFNFLVEQTENVESPMNIHKMAREFKEKSGAPQTMHCLHMRIERMRTYIHSFKHIDTDTKVKLLFALSASVDANFLKELKKNAIVEVDDKKRITKYEAIDGSLELKGDQSQSARQKTALFESKASLPSMISSYFDKKNDSDAIPETEEEKRMWNLIKFITEKCENVDSPLNMLQLTREYNNHIGISIPLETIKGRIRAYCREIQTIEFSDNHSTVKQLFGLSAKLDSAYLEKLREEAHVDVDENNRITNYKAKDGGLELRGDQSRFGKIRIAHLESKKNLRSLIRNYFENRNDVDGVPKNEKKEETWNLIDFIIEKCDNVNYPLSIRQLAKDFNKNYKVSQSFDCFYGRIRVYRREIQNIEVLNTHSKVKQLFCLNVKLNSDYLKELRKDAVVEVDSNNRIIKYTANDNSLTLRGVHYGSGRPKQRCVEKTDKKNVAATADDSEEESENERFDDSSDEYSSEEFDSEFDLDEENSLLDETENLIEPSNTVNNSNNKTPARSRSGMSIDNNLDFDPPTERSHRLNEIEMSEDEEKENDPEITENGEIKTRSGRLSRRGYSEDDNKNEDLDKPENAMEPSNEANDYDNETPARNRSPTEMSFDDNFDFDPPTERSRRSKEIEMRDDEENLPKSKTSSSISHTPKASKRKAVPSESNSSKRTRPSSEESMNPLQIDDSISHDDPSRVELEPFRETLGLPEGIEKDPDIQEISKPRSQVLEAPIKKEYEEEAKTSLKMVLNAFKSLILSLDTPGLSQFQMEIDKKILEAGRGVEVPNNEVIVAMDFLILELTKHDAPEPSEDSISFRDILLMLRTIILNSSFNGLEVILEMLKENIEQLKVLDKKVPVTKVECVLRATLDNICT